MKLEEVRSIAKSRGIPLGKAKKAELIRMIQRDEGNLECFATVRNAECNQVECCWRADCFSASE